MLDYCLQLILIQKRSDLAYEGLPGSVFNEDLSFQAIIKGAVCPRRAGAADSWVLRKFKTVATICWKHTDITLPR